MRDSNPRTQREQIYSLSPLTAWLTAQNFKGNLIAPHHSLRLCAGHSIFPNFLDSYVEMIANSTVEPALGFEPRTYCLQDSCSTTELCRHPEVTKSGRIVQKKYFSGQRFCSIIELLHRKV